MLKNLLTIQLVKTVSLNVTNPVMNQFQNWTTYQQVMVVDHWTWFSTILKKALFMLNKNLHRLLTVACKKTGDLVNLLYKPGISNQGFWALKVLPSPWPPVSKQCEIGGFQKGTLCPCTSRGCKVTGCQTFSISKNHMCS